MERLGITYRDAAVLVRARDLMTPVADALTIGGADSAAHAADVLARAGFDYAPVTHKGRVTGYAAMRELHEEPGRVSARTRPLSVALVVAGDTPFPDLLLGLNDEPFLFVLEGRSPVGFVTRSDLNKHTARLHYYFLLAGLEIALANLVRLHYVPPAAALARLSKKRQRELLGRYAELRASRLDLDELASSEVSDLIVVVESTPELRATFGAHSRSSFHNMVGWLPDFRNAVMHAVRPLLESEREVATLIDREQALRALLDAASERLRNEAPSAFTRS